MKDEKRRAIRTANVVLWISIAAVMLSILVAPLLIDRFQWSISHSYLKPFNWTVVQSLVLAWTLIAILFYVKETWRIANLQEQELGLRKQPVVSFYSRRPVRGEQDRNGEFWTRIRNLSNVHAVARFEASLLLMDRRVWTTLSEMHPEKENYAYSGQCTWSLQAGTTFLGNLDIPDMLEPKNDDELFNRLELSQVRIRSWVAPYDGGDSDESMEWAENPPQYFIWIRRRGRWEPFPPGSSFDVSAQPKSDT